MKFIDQIRQKGKIPTPAFFVIAIFIIVFALPREGKYKYVYEENRPWQYGLLTAQFNFHIHKSAETIEMQKDSIMESYQPYYQIADSVQKEAFLLLEQDIKGHHTPSEYTSYISRKLGEVYKAGIISPDDYERVQSLAQKQLKINYQSESNVVVPRHIASFYTPKLAYEKMLNDAPSYIDVQQLKKMNLNDYLNVNVENDNEKSEGAKEDLLSEISLYDGNIQAGEKIIDRGEIVDARLKTILDSYTLELAQKVGTKVKPGWLFFGEFLMITLFIMSLMLYLMLYRTDIYKKKKNSVFILIVVVLFPLLVAWMVSMKLSGIIYVLPLAILTILVRTFIDSRTAMYTHIVTVFICALILPLPQIPQFIIVQILVGFTCIFSLKKLSERSQLIFCSLFILLTYIVAYTAWILATEGDLNILKENWRIYVYFCINFIFVSFAYLLVYVCERIFGYISEVSMIELSNTNRPLLQELSELAPGTFQHSMQVSNLVVSAAQRIGANAALVRTGALYHDIGKMTNPAFYTENQTSGMNPHANLSEKESARIIIGHVAEGVRLARKHKLPQQIIDFIETHHGKGKAKYFYNSYVNAHPDEIVDIADFTYPGPNPFSRETALLMMADIIEASSRSLKAYTEESISELVNRLLDLQVSDGLFRNAPITFKDIEIIKEVFIDKLMTIYHTRIAYPEIKIEIKTEITTEEIKL